MTYECMRKYSISLHTVSLKNEAALVPVLQLLQLSLHLHLHPGDSPKGLKGRKIWKKKRGTGAENVWKYGKKYYLYGKCSNYKWGWNTHLWIDFRENNSHRKHGFLPHRYAAFNCTLQPMLWRRTALSDFRIQWSSTVGLLEGHTTEWWTSLVCNYHSVYKWLIAPDTHHLLSGGLSGVLLPVGQEWPADHQTSLADHQLSPERCEFYSFHLWIPNDEPVSISPFVVRRQQRYEWFIARVSAMVGWLDWIGAFL